MRDNSQGVYRDTPYNSKYPAKKQFKNLIEKQHEGWVSDEIKNLRMLKFGVIKKWKDCGGESNSPHIIAPLQVEKQKDMCKQLQRLIYNAQYLIINCFMEPPKFSLEGVQKVSHLGWKGNL